MAHLTRCMQMGKLPMMAVCGFEEKLKRNVMSCDVMSDEKLKLGSITFLRTVSLGSFYICTTVTSSYGP